MNAEQLRTLQARIKDRYRNDPTSAFSTLSAKGIVDVDALTCQINRPPNAPLVAGIHEMAGGTGEQACAAEMLLESLVACAGVTFAAVCTAMGLPIRSAELEAQGDLDFRGTMGVDRTVPVGFQQVRLEFRIDSESPDPSLAKAVELAERYCVVAQTLSGVSASWKRSS